MQQKILAAAVATALGGPGPALAANDVEQRLERMEERILHLERRVQAQDEMLRAREDRIAELEHRSAPTGDTAGGWFQGIEVGGLVEVEAFRSDPYEGDATSDIVAATAELGLAARVHDWVAAEVSFLYEEDETDLEVDQAMIAIAPPDGPWAIQAGQFYLPFGVFDTRMVSDPLTLELAETRESAVQAGLRTGGLSAAVYAFNGANSEGGDHQIDNWGAMLGYEVANGAFDFSGSLGYINDIGDSDSIQDSLSTPVLRDHVPGWTASAVIGSGPLTFIAEYVTATDRFRPPRFALASWAFDPMARPPVALEWTRDPAELAFRRGGAQPEAWNLELAYGFRVAGRDASLALGYQGTAEALALELPERRLLSTLSIEILDNTDLSFEWAHDEDYARRDGGTGRSADTLTTQLAVEF
jgi:hypothetical protein